MRPIGPPCVYGTKRRQNVEELDCFHRRIGGARRVLGRGNIEWIQRLVGLERLVGLQRIERLPLSEHRVWMSPNAQLACRFGSLAAFTIYAWAMLSFGLRFSNLTNRGIIERGPYRFVRHPAYVSKGLAWWLELLPSLTASSAIFLLLLNGVYALRAWTEERHLSLDPDYRAYKRRVRWRLLPGLV